MGVVSFVGVCDNEGVIDSFINGVNKGVIISDLKRIWTVGVSQISCVDGVEVVVETDGTLRVPNDDRTVGLVGRSLQEVVVVVVCKRGRRKEDLRTGIESLKLQRGCVRATSPFLVVL